MVNIVVFTLDYLFNLSPDRYFPLQWIPWTLIGLSMVLSMYLIHKIYNCKDSILRKILQKYPGKFIGISVLLAINVLTRIYRIEVFSMRIFTYILIIWLFFAIYGLYHDCRVTYPKRKNQLTPKSQHLEEKYKIHKNKRSKKRRRR